LFFLYDGNIIFVVFIGALECERAWEDDHLKIIIVLENYVRANSSSFKEDYEEEHY
jgi:predicted nucleotidyltransferase